MSISWCVHVHLCACVHVCVCVSVCLRERHLGGGVVGSIGLEQDAILALSSKKSPHLHRPPSPRFLKSFTIDIGASRVWEMDPKAEELG